MKTFISSLLVAVFLQSFSAAEVMGQQKDTVWTLQGCIQYALQQNIQVQKSSLTNEVNKVNAEKAMESRFPSLSGTVNQNFLWAKGFSNATNTYGSYASQNSTKFGLTSSVALFNGGKINYTIKQSEINYKAGQFDVETMKENISLSVMSAYLQILYAEEQVKNSQKQVESTAEQLRLAEERVRLGAIAQSDYLQVKSQLATEKQTLANAESLLAIDKVTLMQLMELPVTSSFAIVHPDFGNNINQNRKPASDSIFNTALGIKPQIQSAKLNKESAQLNVNIAKASYYPSLSLTGGLSTDYTGPSSLAFDYQFRNNVVPSVGLTLSIPIYQRSEVRSEVRIAKIGTQTAALSETDTKNQLRKAIEQACVDVTTAEKKFEASLEEYNATQESYQVASEKFNQGMLNSVDFLIQKTNLITAESNLLQAKYNLIYSYKTLDFYIGVPLSF
jgi:Outer membrane protein